MSYSITDKCDGCGACEKICPAEAIQGEKKKLHLIHGDLCIDCGACGRVCPEGAIRDPFGAICRRTKKTQWEQPRFDLKKCVACTNCIEACPVGSIGFSDRVSSGIRRRFPCLEDEKGCIGCGFCAVACPVAAIAMFSAPMVPPS